MSLLSKTLKKLKPLGKVVNKITDFAAPIAGYVPGIGPVASGIIKGAGDLAGSKNLKTAALDGLKTGGQAYLGGKLAGKLGKLGAGAVASKLGGSDLANDPKFNPDNLTAGMSNAAGGGANPYDGPMPNISGGGLSGLAGKLAPLGKAAAGALSRGGSGAGGGSGFDWKSLLGQAGKVALPAIGAYQASKAQGKADEYRKKGLDLAEANWAAGAPLRSAGIAGLTAPETPINVDQIYNQPRPAFRRLTA